MYYYSVGNNNVNRKQVWAEITNICRTDWLGLLTDMCALQKCRHYNLVAFIHISVPFCCRYQAVSARNELWIVNTFTYFNQYETSKYNAGCRLFSMSIAYSGISIPSHLSIASVELMLRKSGVSIIPTYKWLTGELLPLFQTIYLAYFWTFLIIDITISFNLPHNWTHNFPKCFT